MNPFIPFVSLEFMLFCRIPSPMTFPSFTPRITILRSCYTRIVVITCEWASLTCPPLAILSPPGDELLEIFSFLSSDLPYTFRGLFMEGILFFQFSSLSLTACDFYFRNSPLICILGIPRLLVILCVCLYFCLSWLHTLSSPIFFCLEVSRQIHFLAD